MRYELLIVFILGMLFIAIGMPVLDSIGTWLTNIFASKSVKLQIETEVAKAEIDEGQEDVHIAGFQYDVEDDEEMEDDDE